MTIGTRSVAVVLSGCLLFAGPAAAYAAEPSQSLVTQSDLDTALAQKAAQDEGSRATIQSLLRRAEVKQLAEGYGLDLRRAEGAVSTLDGSELQALAQQAAQADAALSGGAVNVRIGLVAALLIIIIVILLAS